MEKKQRQNRRTNREIENTLIESLENILPKYGFNEIQLSVLVKEARMDHNVFYRKYGTLENFYDEFLNKYNFWISDKANISKIPVIGERQFLIETMQEIFASTLDSEVMQKILLWELEDTTPDVSRKSATNRERLTLNITSYFNERFKTIGADYNAINALIIGGMFYIILQKEINTLCGIDVNEEEGKNRILNGIELIFNLLFDKLEENSRITNTIYNMAADGIHTTKIAKYFEMTPASVRKIVSKRKDIKLADDEVSE
ncbi:MAG: hypothetical protein R3Y59_02600 [bacterium]